jgi:hypothetical protein
MLLGLIGKTPVTIIFMILIICFHGIYKVYKPTEAEGPTLEVISINLNSVAIVYPLTR